MFDKTNKEDEAIKVILSDGTVVLMDYSDGEAYDGSVSVKGLTITAKKTFGVIKSLAKDMKEQIRVAGPDRASIEFSLELEKKGDDIFSKICNVSGKGGMKIKLEWDFGKEKRNA